MRMIGRGWTQKSERPRPPLSPDDRALPPVETAGYGRRGRDGHCPSENELRPMKGVDLIRFDPKSSRASPLTFFGATS